MAESFLHLHSIGESVTFTTGSNRRLHTSIGGSTLSSMRRFMSYSGSRSPSPDSSLAHRFPSPSSLSPPLSMNLNGSHHYAQQRPRVNFEVPRLLSLWEYHSEYGIVHPAACDICSPYIRHLSEASYSDNQPSYQVARTDQQQERKMIFANGVSEGRRVESVERDRDIKHYRAERDRLQEEATSLRIRLSDLQTELGKLLSIGVDRKAPTFSAIPRESAAVADVVQSTSPADIVSPHRVSDASSEAGLLNVSTFSQPGRREDTHEGAATAVKGAAEPAPAVVSSAIPPTAFRPIENELAASAFQVVLRKKGAVPKSIQHVEKIMKSAHQPGNHAALLRVKALCRQAHETPRAQKTDAQRYLLAKWTNPTWDDEHAGLKSSRPECLPTPRLEDPIADHVAYFSRYKESIPRGVPRDPSSQDFEACLQAHRTVGLLRPSKTSGGEKSFDRTQFKLMAAQFFSDVDAYSRFLSRTGFPVASEKSFRPYDALLEGATVEGIARHFAACGVSVEEAEEELNIWAREYLSASAMASAHVLG